MVAISGLLLLPLADITVYQSASKNYDNTQQSKAESRCQTNTKRISTKRNQKVNTATKQFQQNEIKS